MSKLQEKQIVYLYNVLDKNLLEKIISKVGKKYFYLEGDFRKVPYSLKTLRAVDSYVNKNKVYLTKEEYYEEKEKKSLFFKLENIFSSFSNCENYSLEQLQKVYKMLKEEVQ
jgi:Zn-finger nucleic acid-binding protein